MTTTVHIDPAAPVFAGHYPGFPILPGLYLVGYVHDAVSTVDIARRLRLVALDRARFLRPVRPGDELRIEAVFTGDGDDLRCAATVSTASGPVAEVRLRYRGMEPGGGS